MTQRRIEEKVDSTNYVLRVCVCDNCAATNLTARIENEFEAELWTSSDFQEAREATAPSIMHLRSLRISVSINTQQHCLHVATIRCPDRPK